MKKVAIFAAIVITLLVLGWGFVPPIGRPARMTDLNPQAPVGEPLWSLLTGQDLQTKINHALWGPKNGLAVGTTPAIDEGRGHVYFGAGDHRLYCITLSGQILWYFTAIGAIDASPAIADDGTIYIGDMQGAVYSLRSDGTVKWKYSTGSWAISGSPAIGRNGNIYVPGWSKDVYALDPQGRLLWTFSTPYSVQSSIVVDHRDFLYFGSLDHFLYCVRPDGSLAWKFQTGKDVVGSPIILQNGRVLFGSFDHHFYALDDQGKELWSLDAGKDLIGGAPTQGEDGTVYFTTNHDLYAITDDGAVKWKFTSDAPVFFPAVGADGTIFVSGVDGQLFAISPAGKKIWVLTVPGRLFGPTLSRDGTLYVGSLNQKLYAIRTASFGLAQSPWPKSRGDLRNTGRENVQ